MPHERTRRRSSVSCRRAGWRGACFFELLRTFPREIGSALRNKWGLVTLAVNAGFPLAVYAIVHYVLNVNGGIWMALVIGLTFPVIIRSRFTVYRQIGKKDDAQLSEVSLRLDQFYQTLQDKCYREINTTLAEELDSLAAKIKDKFTAKELEDRIRNRIASGRIAEIQQRQDKDLQDALDKHKGNPKRLHHALALLLIDLSTPDGIRKLLR